MTDPAIRKNTHPMAPPGSIGAAAMSQPVASTAIPAPATTSDRHPSP
jgi:hypothetical protein